MEDIQVSETPPLPGTELVAAINTGFDSLQKNIGGILSKSVSGGAGTTTLTDSESWNGILVFTGVLTGDRIVEVPAAAMSWKGILNSTTGSYKLTFKAVGGAGFILPPGKLVAAVCNATDVLKTGDAGYRLIKRTIIAASGTHTYDPLCVLKRIAGRGAGAAGGGATTSSDGQASAGSGGGSGAVVDGLFLNTASTASITVGAGGTGSSGADGGNSGTSSLTDTDASISFTAATGGTVGSSNLNFFTRTGGDGGTATVSGSGLLNYVYRPGVRGQGSWASGTGVNSRMVGVAGYGAACAGGTQAHGAVASSTTNVGSAGSDGDKGCGGGGANILRASGAVANTAGGAGGPAEFIIEEYAL